MAQLLAGLSIWLTSTTSDSQHPPLRQSCLLTLGCVAQDVTMRCSMTCKYGNGDSWDAASRWECNVAFCRGYPTTKDRSAMVQICYNASNPE